jgi:ribosome-binding protein aMBF1 (putative translation factor)
VLLPLYAHLSRPLWTGQLLAYPAVQKSGTAADPRDLRQAFAANLRRFRHAKGVSQEDLAYEADVNRTYVSKLEKGVSYPGLEIIAKLANALGVELAELLMLPPRRGKRTR